MDLGLEAAGFEPVACLEIDGPARSTLIANRPTWPVHEVGDVVAAARWTDLGGLVSEQNRLDLIAGGPPCQPFSVAGQWSSNGRLGMEDDRAATVHALLDLFERLLPRAVLLENVQGFVSGPTSALSEIEQRVNRVNSAHGTRYSVHWRLVNAADYGVPQNRRRVVVILADGFEWEWPEPAFKEQPLTAWDALWDLTEEPTTIPRPKGRWTALLPSVPEGHNYQWLTHEGGGEALFGYRTRYWSFLLKLSRHRPSWTLPASPGPSTGPFHWDNRPLSVREMLRIQSFPDSWVLSGAYREQVRQAGNATPPALAEVMGLRIAQLLTGTAGPIEQTLVRARAATTVVETPPVAIPATFRTLVGKYEPHKGTGLGPSPRLGPADDSSKSEHEQEGAA